MLSTPYRRIGTIIYKSSNGRKPSLYFIHELFTNSLLNKVINK